MEPAVAFGQVLRALRRDAGLSQEELALGAEIERNYVSLIERGINQPSIRVIYKLADALGTPASQMLALVEERMRSQSDPK